jgi:hypothetical protein
MNRRGGQCAMYNRWNEEENMRRLKPDMDPYKEIINGENTYKAIASELLEYGSIIVGWTEGEYSHRDILFTYKPTKLGNLQGGLRWAYLYVSIMHFTSMGFLIEDMTDNVKAPEYLKEKLHLSDDVTSDKICELINGVIQQIDKLS